MDYPSMGRWSTRLPYVSLAVRDRRRSAARRAVQRRVQLAELHQRMEAYKQMARAQEEKKAQTPRPWRPWREAISLALAIAAFALLVIYVASQ